ncbi:MAG: DUF6686 family protein [Bacteroidota bacterium]
MSMNHSPSFQILHHNEVGYIARCSCCEDVQIELGNIATHMDVESFHNFHASLIEISHDLESSLAEAPSGQKIMLRTPVQNIYMAFTLREFAATLDLFGQASVMLEINELVGD